MLPNVVEWGYDDLSDLQESHPKNTTLCFHLLIYQNIISYLNKLLQLLCVVVKDSLVHNTNTRSVLIIFIYKETEARREMLLDIAN